MKNKKPVKQTKSKVQSSRINKDKKQLKKQAQKFKNQIKPATITKHHNQKKKPKEKSGEFLKSNKNPKKKSKEHNTKKVELLNEAAENEIAQNIPRRRITHQTLFCQATRKNRSKLKEKKKKKIAKINKLLEEKLNSQKVGAKQKHDLKYKQKLQTALQQKEFAPFKLNKKQRAELPLRERMMQKLKSARFRYLNEQMYTTSGKEAKKFFDSDPDAYKIYHEGYRQQVARWPLNPLDVIIEKIRKLPQTHVIADFGCGDAKLSKSVPNKVYSFDLVAGDSAVTACDMAHVPLENGSIDVAVFCLSLMGTNLKDYLLEAHRVLKVGGSLKIAEVESRFENIDEFIKDVQRYGFTKTRVDFSHDLFYFLDFTKKETNVKQNKLPNLSLNPCLYKRR